MTLCDRCSNGEFHGFPPKGAPEWDVGTVHFRCQKQGHGDSVRTLCVDFRRGEPKRYDKHGREME